ncbi:peptidoglycan recognition protein 1-like [Saccostrea cucullata]|uniref:peptidoglycan recognition protein 1-like n=1 Tax=Saccostrea cuccullata TaxID=36930 RepID=UPI002ED2F6DE
MSGVEEQQIMDRTGHCSQAGVRKYKRSSVQMEANVSKILDPPKECTENSTPMNSLDGCDPDITDKCPAIPMTAASVQDTKWDDIGYNFLVGDDGNIYEGQGWGRQGIHVGNNNDKALGVSFIGTFMDKVFPGEAAIGAAKNLIQCGVDLGYISTDYQLLGHRAVKDTLCPGDNLYDAIKEWHNFSEKLKPLKDKNT